MAQKDLKPVQSKEEAKSRGRKGGIASGKARREKRLMRETLDLLLNMPVKDGQFADVESICNFASIKGKNISVQDAILIAQIQKAMKGDTRAAEYVRDTIGQKPTESIDMSMNLPDPFEGLTTEELKKMIDDD